MPVTTPDSAPRKVLTARIIASNGTAVDVTMRNSLLPDDILVQGMKAEGYRVVTGRDVFPTFDRTVKDYLIRLKTEV